MTDCARKTALILSIFVAFVPSSRNAAAEAINVATGKVEGIAGKEVQVPITLKGAKAVKGVSGVSLRMSYDPALLTFKSLERGPILPDAMINKSLKEDSDPGKIALGFICGSKTPDSKELARVEADGVVLNVVFLVNENASYGQKCPLKLDTFYAMDTQEPPFELQVNSEEGEFAVGYDLPWLWIYVAIGVAAFLFLLMLLLLLTRSKGQPVQPAYPGMGQMPPGGFVPTFQPEGQPFSHLCVKCGGVFQLPRPMLGKPFQCGACGTMQVAGPG